MTNNTSKKGFWDFCCEHPVALVLSLLVILWGLECITQSVTGHYPPDDGFWKQENEHGTN